MIKIILCKERFINLLELFVGEGDIVKRGIRVRVTSLQSGEKGIKIA